MLNPEEAIRIWLCDCGRVHVETPHCRASFTPAEFVARLRSAAVQWGTEPAARLSAACENTAALRAAQPFVPRAQAAAHVIQITAPEVNHP